MIKLIDNFERFRIETSSNENMGVGERCSGFAKGAEQSNDMEECESLNDPNSRLYPGTIPSENEAFPYRVNLFSYEDMDHSPNYHFGLIRGYHRELYEEPQSQRRFLCCQSLDRETVDRIKRRNRVLSYQITGILFGAVFVFFGIIALIVTFVVSSDESKDYFWHSLEIPSMYVHIIAIIGLTVLSLGSAMISFCLLVPIFVGHIQRQDSPRFWCTTGDMYYKQAEKMAPNQFLYFDAAPYGKFVGNTDVRKIQPELKSEKD